MVDRISFVAGMEMVPDDDPRVDAAARAARVAWDGIDSPYKDQYILDGWRTSVRAALFASDQVARRISAVQR